MYRGRQGHDGALDEKAGANVPSNGRRMTATVVPVRACRPDLVRYPPYDVRRTVVWQLLRLFQLFIDTSRAKIYIVC